MGQFLLSYVLTWFSRARKKLETGETMVTSGDFSRLLYEGCRINTYDVFQGFLLNEILLKVI